MFKISFIISICFYLFPLTCLAQKNFSSGAMTHFTFPVKGNKAIKIELIKNDTLKYTLFDNYLIDDSIIKLYDQRLSRDKILALLNDSLSVIAFPIPKNIPSGFYDLKFTEGVIERKEKIVFMK
jgi:hypothetical protein